MFSGYNAFELIVRGQGGASRTTLSGAEKTVTGNAKTGMLRPGPGCQGCQNFTPNQQHRYFVRIRAVYDAPWMVTPLSRQKEMTRVQS
jgi:hypothetical protein